MARQRHQDKEKERAILYMVATPIGNLEDLTFRASRILKEVKLVACEDTRRTRKLLAHIGSTAKTISCHMHKEQQCATAIIRHLKEGIDVAFASDAGVPAISDPGAKLVARVREAGFMVVPVPGPSSVTAALSVAGIRSDAFYFGGFLPARGKERKEALRTLHMQECTIVLLEAPHRIMKTLEDLLEVLGNRNAFLGREMTKLHETYWYGPLSMILAKLSNQDVRGEFTLVVEGHSRKKDMGWIPCGDMSDIVTRMLNKGLSVKDAAALASEITGLSKKQAYGLALHVSEQLRSSKDG